MKRAHCSVLAHGFPENGGVRGFSEARPGVILGSIALLFMLFRAGAFPAVAVAAGAASADYHVIGRLELGGEGGWDYLSVDGEARRLYLSRGSRVVVVDLETGRPAGEIPDTPGVHGIALAPGLNRGFTSNGRANTASIFDLKTLEVLGRVKTGENPDAILYDPFAGQVFTFNGRSREATVFDALSGEVKGAIELGGKPEFAATDGKGEIFVNIEDTGEVVVIDSARLAVKNRISLDPCREPTGMAIDPERGRLFVGCHNKLMAIVDARAGKMIGAAPIGEHVDACGFDPESGLAFSSNGDGTLTVVRESSPGKFEAARTVATQFGARTMAIDPKTHIIYLPTARFLPPPAQPPEGGSKARGEMIENSFVVLMVAP